MSLSQYKQKRDFKKTAEPKAVKKSAGKALRFVVQKHDASHLHYDFRLEMDGVLKSWAVPKGPSLNPDDKRLAMQVEDHPFDYRNFEGTIPEGEYGGGTVMVWDEGEYELMDAGDMTVKDQEKELKKMLQAGNIKFELKGTKLKGSWALFRIKARDGSDRTWILMKHKDSKASVVDVLKKNKSPKSGKTLEQIAKAHGVELKHPEGTAKVVKTKPVKVELAPAPKTTAKKAASKKASASKKKPVQDKLIPSDATDLEVKVDKHDLQLTNLQKLYWKNEKFTKGDMLRYYHQIAPYMMPYMKDRPQSLNRHPNGITGQNFYQKDVAGKVPEWMKTHVDYSESNDKNVEYLVCSNEATLLYMANLGCIEMHPWHSRAKTWEKPDWCLIDLDPSDNNTFDQVIETAQVVKQVLDEVGADAYMKTSGSSGIHIMIPLGARYSFEQSKQLAELIVNLVHWELPELTSLERSPSKRKNEIYLDYLQNRQIQTAACVYSLRPKPGVPVSTPLHWEELRKGMKPTDFNAYNIFDRLKDVGDIFKPVLGKGIVMQQVLKKIEALMP